MVAPVEDHRSRLALLLARPNFVRSSNVIGGVTSYGLNRTCAGTGGVYRLDRSWNLDWIRATFGRYL
jgi:hypothetical protein